MIKYRDENDKCFGIAGMAMAMSIWDADEQYISVSLDKNGFDCIAFTDDFLFTGDPAVSPKISWRHCVKCYQTMIGVAISNVMSRTIVNDNKPLSNATRRELLDTFTQMGVADYSLSNDEIRHIFDKSYNYLLDLYSNEMVKDAVKTIASTLGRERTLSASEINDMLGDIIQ